MTISYVRHVFFICTTWPFDMSDTTHSYVRQVSFIHAAQRVRARHDSFICAIWHMFYSYVLNDSFIYSIWLTHTCIMTHAYVGHDSLIRGTRFLHTNDIYDIIHVWHMWISFHRCMSCLMYMYTVHVCVSCTWDTTYMYEKIFTHTCTVKRHMWHTCTVNVTYMTLYSTCMSHLQESHVYVTLYSTCICDSMWLCTRVTYTCTVKSWSKETPPPGGVSYLLCSLIKNRV